MKKGLLIMFFVIMVIAVFAACGTSSPARTETKPVIDEEADEVRIDWKGRNVNAQIPNWVQYAATGDENNDLSQLPRLEGKKAIPISYEGANLRVVESFLNTQAFANCAQRIRAAAERLSGDATDGDLQNPDAIALAKEFNSLYANATITGLNKEMDSWVKTRSKSKGTETYTIYAVYAISNDDLKASIAETFGKVEAKTKAQQDVKAKLQDRMNRLIENAKF